MVSPQTQPCSASSGETPHSSSLGYRSFAESTRKGVNRVNGGDLMAPEGKGVSGTEGCDQH